MKVQIQNNDKTPPFCTPPPLYYLFKFESQHKQEELVSYQFTSKLSLVRYQFTSYLYVIYCLFMLPMMMTTTFIGNTTYQILLICAFHFTFHIELYAKNAELSTWKISNQMIKPHKSTLYDLKLHNSPYK